MKDLRYLVLNILAYCCWRRVHRRCRLVPNLYFVAVRIDAKQVRLTWAEFPLVAYRPTCLQDGASGGFDVRRRCESKAKMNNTAAGPGAFDVLLEDERVKAPRC